MKGRSNYVSSVVATASIAVAPLADFTLLQTPENKPFSLTL